MQKESPRWFAGKRWLPTERSHSFRALPGSAFRAFCRRVPNLVDGLFDGVAQRFALVELIWTGGSFSCPKNRPINVGPKLFAGDGTACGRFDIWAASGWDVADVICPL